MEVDEIKQYYKLLGHKNQTELRAINPFTKEIRNFHFNDEKTLLNLCRDLNKNFNLYLGVNERKEGGTKKEDIISVKIIPVDIDCINKPATNEDIIESMQITMKIINDCELQGFIKPSVFFSGNGYQLLFKIPEIIITKENINDLEDKIQEFEKRLIGRYSTEKVRLDNVGDLPRIMRIAGTYNLKSKSTSKIIEINDIEDDRLKQHILELELSKSIVVGSLSEELKEKIRNNENIQNLFNADIEIMKNFKSRSEAELSLICRLVSIGLNKEQIFRTMASCHIGKWQEANISYRELSYKKAIELVSREKLIKIDNPSLNDVYTVYRKWLYLEDTKRIDVVFATYLTQYLYGTPIWLILVGNSGDGKTEQVMALKKCENFHIEHNLTPKTLVSGNPKVHDLAPELNGKVLIIPDMAQILQLPPQEKGELWGQLRDLYDGFAGKSSGLGKRAKYSGLKITLIACSTPKIDGQILVHQDLGTRELIYRTEDTEGKIDMMEFAMRNEEEEEQMKEELSDITYKFLKDKRIIRNELTQEESTKLMNIALFISKVRASAEIDSYTNELRNIVYPEQPTRIVKQLKRLYLSLKSLEEGYPSERAFSILWHLAESCAFPIRINIFKYFINEYFNSDKIAEWHSTSKISNDLAIGKRTSQRELNILWNMRIIEKVEREEGNRYFSTEYWRVNEKNGFIKDYINLLDTHFTRKRFTKSVNGSQMLSSINKRERDKRDS